MTKPNPITRTSSAVRPTSTILREQVSSSVKHRAARLSQVRLVRVPDLQDVMRRMVEVEAPRN